MQKFKQMPWIETDSPEVFESAATQAVPENQAKEASHPEINTDPLDYQSTTESLEQNYDRLCREIDQFEGLCSVGSCSQKLRRRLDAAVCCSVESSVDGNVSGANNVSVAGNSSGSAAGNRCGTLSGDLEQRVAVLERALGTLTPELSASERTVSATLSNIEHNLQLLLLPDALDSACAKIQSLSADLQRLESNTHSNSDRTAFVYSKLQSLEPTAALIPHLVQRLHSLKTLHLHTHSFTQALLDLQQEQNALELVLKGVEGVQMQLAVNMNANVMVIKNELLSKAGSS